MDEMITPMNCYFCKGNEEECIVCGGQKALRKHNEENKKLIDLFPTRELAEETLLKKP